MVLTGIGVGLTLPTIMATGASALPSRRRTFLQGAAVGAAMLTSGVMSRSVGRRDVGGAPPAEPGSAPPGLRLAGARQRPRR